MSARAYLLTASLLFVGGSVEAADYFVCTTPEAASSIHSQIRGHAVDHANSDYMLSAEGYLAAVRNGYSWWWSEEEHLSVFLSQFTPCKPARTLGNYELNEQLGTTEVSFVGGIVQLKVSKVAPPGAQEGAQNVWVVSVRATSSL